MMMTLAEAFRVLTELRARADETRSDEAQVLIYQELHALSRRLHAAPDERQESGSRCFERLLRGGPRSITLEDEVVQAYLWKMLKNDDLDRKRRRSREAPELQRIESLALEPSDERNPENRSIAQQQQEEDQQLVHWAMQFVFQELKELLAARFPARYQAGFKEAVDQLRSLVLEASTFDVIVLRESGEVTVQTRNRIYQRHCRAREQYLDWLENEMPSGNFSNAQRVALNGLIARLRR
jgi:hypothetical protein